MPNRMVKIARVEVAHFDYRLSSPLLIGSGEFDLDSDFFLEGIEQGRPPFIEGRRIPSDNDGVCEPPSEAEYLACVKRGNLDYRPIFSKEL